MLVIATKDIGMSYQFPHKTREKKKKDTVRQFEKHYKIICKIRDRIHREIAEKNPLIHDLLLIEKELIELDFHDRYSFPYELWRKSMLEVWKWEEVKDSVVFSRDVSGYSAGDIVFTRNKSLHGNSVFKKTIGDKTYISDFEDDNKDIAVWKVWNSRSEIFKERLNIVKNASFGLNLLERHKNIFAYEAVMIILGFSPDDFPRTEFKRWDFIGEIGSWGLNKKDHPEIQEIDFKIDYRKFDEWTWIKREFGFKDRVRLKFHQREGLSEEEIALIESPPEINTQDFILWALKQGYIEEANKELQRNQNNEPFDKEFSQLLYKELKDRNLISGKYSEEWQWQTSSNSLHYFIKELWNNTLPREWYARFPKKDPSISSGPDWSEHGIMHYFQYKEKTPIRLQRPIGQVDREVEIDKVIDILFEKVNDPKGKKEI